MTLGRIKDEIAARMKDLIARAEVIQTQAGTILVHDDHSKDPMVRMRVRRYPQDVARVWQHNFGSLIGQVVDKDSIHWEAVARVASSGIAEYAVDEGRLLLVALVDDLQLGLLDKPVLRVLAEVASDYLGMARALLKEGVQGHHEHVPAAVLAGAVLERGLRDLCARQTPPVPVTKPNSEPKTMNPLIDDLKKAGAFNEVRAKLLRAWADIRNAAAHGEFEKFDRAQVEGMVAGITQFLADAL